MQKLLLPFIIFFTGTLTAQNINSHNGYVDLGLPSGTEWKKLNENGYYFYDEAIQKFGNQLPSKEEWEELINSCDWYWDGAGYVITGTNGASIYLPALGFSRGDEGEFAVHDAGYYWSLTAKNSTQAYFVLFGLFCRTGDVPQKAELDVLEYTCYFSVRLVQRDK